MIPTLINEILQRKTHKYTDHSIQDEFLKLISKDHLTMSNALDHTLEIYKLIKICPEEMSYFADSKKNVPGQRNLCPTRWTVRATSLESIHTIIILLY